MDPPQHINEYVNPLVTNALTGGHRLSPGEKWVNL